MPIVPSAELIERLRAELPELPAARVRRFEASTRCRSPKRSISA